MIIDWREADQSKLLDLWNQFHPERYQVDADVFRINTTDADTFDWGTSLVDVDFDGDVRALISIKKAPAKHHKVGDPDAVHLSALAFTDPTHAVDLMSEAKKILRQRGVTTILFGMDSRHFWPGVPADVPAINMFLTVEGFSLSGEYFDVERDLANYEPPRPMPTERVHFRVLNQDDHAALVKFFNREFPGRWRYDILWKIEHEESFEGLVGLFHNDEIHGFAAIQDFKNTKFPIGGAVWRKGLGENWGALGPIGVSQQVRGEGWGGALLSAGLLELKARGVGPCIIDWTTLDEFYGKHGFEKSRIYRAGKLLI